MRASKHCHIVALSVINHDTVEFNLAWTGLFSRIFLKLFECLIGICECRCGPWISLVIDAFGVDQLWNGNVGSLVCVVLFSSWLENFCFLKESALSCTLRSSHGQISCRHWGKTWAFKIGHPKFWLYLITILYCYSRDIYTHYVLKLFILAYRNLRHLRGKKKYSMVPDKLLVMILVYFLLIMYLLTAH